MRRFIRLLDFEGDDVTLGATRQISPDGLFRCDEGSQPLIIGETGLCSLKLREFGQWLRLRCELRGAGPRTKVLIYLALKE